MEPENYCGASRGHVICNNFVLEKNKPLVLFGNKDIVEDITWLDMKNCSGCLSSTTFSLLPCLQYINIKDCNFQMWESNVFATLEKLKSLDIRSKLFPPDKEVFEGSKYIESITLTDLESINSNYLSHLQKLKSISIESCTFKNIRFTGLNCLEYLNISSCNIQSISSDNFDSLDNLQMVILSDNTITEFDKNSILKMRNLKKLSFSSNVTDAIVDYNIFKQLPGLECILFPTSIYKGINFSGFPSLKKVQIGIYNNESDHPLADDVIERLKLEDIPYEFVFCGKVIIDMSKVQICA